MPSAATGSAHHQPKSAFKPRPAGTTIDRSDGVIRFTGLELRARLVLPADGDTDRAKRLLEKAEAACLITNSLRFARR